MKYNKPEVIAVVRATEAVKHSAVDKGLGIYFESSSQNYLDTVNAYEADE